MFLAFLIREITLTTRRSYQFTVLFSFYVICSFIFLALDSSLIGWTFLITICPLLVSLLAFSNIFYQDDKDYVLQDIAFAKGCWRSFILVKILMFWVVIGLPQTIWFFIMHVLLPSPISLILAINVMIMNSLNLSLLMVLVAALCLRSKIHGGLVFLLVIPLYSPGLFYLLRTLTESHNDTCNGLLALTCINAIITIWFTPKILKEAIQYEI